MNLKKFLTLFSKEEETSKDKAKDRLTLILAHERTSNIEFMDDLKRDIMEVVQKYIKEPKDVKFKTSDNQNISALEVEILI